MEGNKLEHRNRHEYKENGMLNKRLYPDHWKRSRDLRYGVWGSDDSEWVQSCIERFLFCIYPSLKLD